MQGSARILWMFSRIVSNTSDFFRCFSWSPLTADASWGDEKPSAVKQRGQEKKGLPNIASKSFSQKGPKWCSALSIGVIGKSALEIGHFLRRNFWMISGGPFLSRPLCCTAETRLLSASERCMSDLYKLQVTVVVCAHLPN